MQLSLSLVAARRESWCSGTCLSIVSLVHISHFLSNCAIVLLLSYMGATRGNLITSLTIINNVDIREFVSVGLVTFSCHTIGML